MEGEDYLETAAMAVEALFIEMQGHAPSQLYEDGYADAIAAAAKVIRRLKPRKPGGAFTT